MAGNEILVIPTEAKGLEPFGSIEVKRARVEGEDSRVFTNPDEALQWAIESPGYMYIFEITLPESGLFATLYGIRRSDEEKLLVAIPGKSGISQRSVNGHHAVSSDYDNFFDFIINLEPDQLSLFDRGVVWVKLQGRKRPRLVFNVNPGIHTAEELKQGILQMAHRVENVLNDLLRGTGF